jgi:hypothetical protein
LSIRFFRLSVIVLVNPIPVYVSAISEKTGWENRHQLAAPPQSAVKGAPSGNRAASYAEIPKLLPQPA